MKSEVFAGAPVSLACHDLIDGIHHWRALVSFAPLERSDGVPPEGSPQTVAAIAEVYAEGSDYRSKVARVTVSASSEVLAKAPRCWLAVSGHAVHVMVATAGEAQRCTLLAFGRGKTNDELWRSMRARFAEAERLNLLGELGPRAFAVGACETVQ